MSVPELFNYWLQAGRVDVGFLGAAQIDRLAALNTTVPGRRPTAVITDLGVPEAAAGADDRELVLASVHPGLTVDDVRAATGWPLRIADSLLVTSAPTSAELGALRAMTADTAGADG